MSAVYCPFRSGLFLRSNMAIHHANSGIKIVERQWAMTPNRFTTFAFPWGKLYASLYFTGLVNSGTPCIQTSPRCLHWRGKVHYTDDSWKWWRYGFLVRLSVRLAAHNALGRMINRSLRRSKLRSRRSPGAPKERMSIFFRFISSLWIECDDERSFRQCIYRCI